MASLHLLTPAFALAGLITLGACSTSTEGPGQVDAGSSSSGGGATDEPSELPRSMRVTLSGAESLLLECEGDDVGVGFLGNAPAGMFSLECFHEVGGRLYDFSVGPLNVSFAPGAEFTGSSVLEVETLDTSTPIVSYDSMAHVLFFDATADGSESSSHLRFTRVEELPSEHPQLARYHLVGGFDFRLSSSPEEPSDACIREAQENAGRHPAYDAELCGAEKVEGQGSFDIVQDFLR